MKALLVVIAAGAVGSYAAERWLLRSTDDDPSGFVTIRDGFGIDDIVRGAAVAASYFAIKSLLPKA